MVLKQAKRLLSLQTVLGDNELLLASLTGREEMSRLFEFHLDLISECVGADFVETQLL